MVKMFTINVGGRLITTEQPLVMGILNITPDSFYEGSRVLPAEVAVRVRKMIDEGADIIDVGACSTRPQGEQVSQKEELARLHSALEIIDKEFPDAVVSIDTYRAKVVAECCSEHNVAIINDVSGFEWDSEMFDAVVAADKAYVLTHSVGRAGDEPRYSNFFPQMMQSLSQKMWQLHQSGVKDVIVDVGFGFGKSLEQNYQMLAHLNEFKMLDAPLLVGVSRKSMITKLLGVQASDALNGTTVLNTIALMKGADILRVHDVAAAVESVRLCQAVAGVI